MIPCTWNRCELQATVALDGWLFGNPIDYCREHAEALVAELKLMGWTRRFCRATAGTRRSGQWIPVEPGERLAA